jgi:hypothetical protein
MDTSDILKMMNRKSAAVSRNARAGSVVLICPECQQAAEYRMVQDADFPKYGSIEPDGYDPHFEDEYFTASGFCTCPLCWKTFTATGKFGFSSVETDSHHDNGGFAKEAYLALHPDSILREFADEGSGLFVFCPKCEEPSYYYVTDRFGTVCDEEDDEEAVGEIEMWGSDMDLIPESGANYIRGKGWCPCCDSFFPLRINLDLDYVRAFNRRITLLDFTTDEAERRLQNTGQAAQYRALADKYGLPAPANTDAAPNTYGALADKYGLPAPKNGGESLSDKYGINSFNKKLCSKLKIKRRK